MQIISDNREEKTMDEATLNNFTSYFQYEIYKDTLKYEKYRIFRIIIVYIIIPILYIAFILRSPFFFNDFYEGNKYIYKLLNLFVVIIYFCFHMFLTSILKNKIKKEIIAKVLKFVNMTTRDKKSKLYGIQNTVASLHIFPKFQYCYCDDYIMGEYKGSKLKIYYIKLSKIEGLNNTIILFNGAFVCLPDLNLQKADIVIDSHLSKSSLEKIDVENETFNKEYSVFTNNPNEAKSFLTPDVVNKIIQYTQQHGNIYFSFEQSMSQ